MINFYLLWDNLLNHSLHPGSLRVQANLLAWHFQSGTAKPNKKQTCSQYKLMKPTGDNGKNLNQLSRWDESSRSYMISVSSQWELRGMISTFAMWRPMGLLSVMMQRQCCSTPRLLRLIPVRRQKSHMVTKCTAWDSWCIKENTENSYSLIIL